MEKVQSSEEVLKPAPTEAEEVELVVDAATAAAAATPAPEVPGTEEDPCPTTSEVWTDRTSRILEIGTLKNKTENL